MRSRKLIGLAFLIFFVFPSHAYSYGGNGGSDGSSASSGVTTKSAGVIFIVEGKPEPGSNSNGTLNIPHSPLSTRDVWSDIKIGFLKAGLWTLETFDSLSFIGFYIGGKKAGLVFPTTFLVGGVYHTTKNAVRILVYGTKKTIEVGERSIGGRYLNYYILNRSDNRKRSSWKLELEKNQVIHYKYEYYTPRKKVSP